MTTQKGTPFSEIIEELEQNEEYKKADRQLKPYHAILITIIRRRNELGLTQKDLAEKANTYQSRISKIESAEHDIRLSTLIQIAEALKTEVSIHLIPFEETSSYEKTEDINYSSLLSSIKVSLRPSENSQNINVESNIGEKVYARDYELSV